MNEKMKNTLVILLFGAILAVTTAKKTEKSLVEAVNDYKDFKKVLRTKNNVLVLFSNNLKKTADVTKLIDEVSVEVKGLATVVSVDCNDKEGKKLCKKLKVSSDDSFVIKHYKDGDFHKNYDRALRSKSLVTFLKDPSGDLPWDEDPASQDVQHLHSPKQLSNLLKTESGPILAMFYAPWCGHCKRLKPDYQIAATEMKGKAVLAAMDVNKPENSPVSRMYNITGFPTLLFFDGGELQYPYPGGNNKDEIKKFLADPKPEADEKPQESAWSDEPSEVVHLTDDTFEEFMTENPSVLVMFYAPWCGHCKRAKPHFVSAAAKMKEDGVSGKLAAVDCTVHTKLSRRFEVKGFPTIKYFKDGQLAFDVGDAREEAVIMKFMKDPKEPPPPPPPETPWSEEESEVVHLTEDDFKSYLKKKKHVLVMFYAPWCGHCKKAKPEFTGAAEHYKDNTKVEYAAVDCTKHNPICSANDVSGFPTFKYFNYFKESKAYDGGRTQKDFINFMSDPLSPFAGQAPPPPSPEEQWSDLQGSIFLKHLTGAEFDHYMRYKETVLVMFYAPWCGHCKAMKADYAKAAQQLTDEQVPHVLATIDATIESSLASRFDIRGYPTLKLFSKGQVVEDYKGGRTKNDIVKYIREKAGNIRDEL